MEKTLQLHTTATLPKLNNGQKGLLKLINECVSINKPCDFEDVVKCYCKFVRKTYYRERRKFITLQDGRYQSVHDKYDEFDVYSSFKSQNFIWTYHLRALIKQWFIGTIGNLVLKGQLLILPIIQIPD